MGTSFSVKTAALVVRPRAHIIVKEFVPPSRNVHHHLQVRLGVFPVTFHTEPFYEVRRLIIRQSLKATLDSQAVRRLVEILWAKSYPLAAVGMQNDLNGINYS